jgi:hypothetical protein
MLSRPLFQSSNVGDPPGAKTMNSPKEKRRAWHARLQDTSGFLKRSGIATRVAQQFTQRDNGVVKFLEAIEAYPPQKGTP